MKKQILRVIISFSVLLGHTVYAQKVDLSIIENVNEAYVWNIVYQSFKNHDINIGEVDMQTKKAVSGYYKYTNLMIDNRAKYQVTFINGTVEIQFIERQYLSDKGWVVNYLPLTKGVKKKYIYPIAQTIRELNEEAVSNQVPLAVFMYSPSSASTSTPVVFDASMSSDVEDDVTVLSIRWDWENDGNWDTDWDTSKRQQHTFVNEGVVAIKMEIKDIYGFTNEVTHVMSIQNFKSCPNQPYVIYNDQIYNTVLIGSQCWIKENLNVGELIDGSTSMTNNGVIEKYSYDNNPINNNRHGGLYQWSELMSYSFEDNTCGICPQGDRWRIPTKNDYVELIEYLGGKDVAGAKLKEAVSISWSNQDNSNSEASGFNALSGGVMTKQDGFNGKSNSVHFATSDSEWQLVLTNESDEAILMKVQNSNGVYVRCIRKNFDKDNLAETISNEPPKDGIIPPPPPNPPKGPDDNGPPNDEIDGPNPPKGEITVYNPPSTNCPKKEYLLYFLFNDKNVMDSLNNLTSSGYKLINGSMIVCYFEKGNGSVDSIKIEQSVDRLSIETLNKLAEEKWVVVSSFFATYLIKDENAPDYEYKYGEELSNSGMGKYDEYLSGGNNIHDLNDIYGDKGWEMVFISMFRGDKSLFRRIKGSNVKYEYKTLILSVADKDNGYKRVQDLGAEGWQYCSVPSILKGKTGQSPIVLKRRIGMGDSYSFQIIVIDDPSAELPAYIHITGDPEKEKQMLEANKPLIALLNNFGQAGWKFEMSIKAHREAYGEDKMIVVFQVPDNCNQ